MDNMQKLDSCVNSVRSKVDFTPQIALILGSGLGDFADTIDIKYSLPYTEIEGFPVSTVPGHKGRFVFGNVDDVPVVIMQGRVHYYEGYPMSDVVLPTRLMGRLGAKALFLTNAAGGVNWDFSAGDLMLIEDHISMFVPSPLLGANLDALGPRFPDMSDIYGEKLRRAISDVARQEDIPLQKGVYMQLSGPQFESPAEIRACRTLGADAVGMSTCCEAIAARHMGMQVCGVSCITNLACGMTSEPLSHDEVQETADRVAQQFQRLVRRSLVALGKTLA